MGKPESHGVINKATQQPDSSQPVRVIVSVCEYRVQFFYFFFPFLFFFNIAGFVFFFSSQLNNVTHFWFHEDHDGGAVREVRLNFLLRNNCRPYSEWFGAGEGNNESDGMLGKGDDS